MSVDCEKAREAISARIDGEDPGVPAGALDTHLAACPACRDWQQRAHTLTRRTRLGGPLPDHDLTAQVLAAIPPSRPGRRRALVQRAGLVAVALAQLAFTVPLLILGRDHGADAHAAHELGSFGLALAIAFAVGAIRPALSAGLAWPCGIAAASLVITAVTDLVNGQTLGADEAPHLIAAAGALLLFWQARTNRSQGAASLAPMPARTGQFLAPARRDSAFRSPIQPERPGGSDAAQSTGPDPAARAGTAGLQDGRPDQEGRAGPEEPHDDRAGQPAARERGEAVA